MKEEMEGKLLKDPKACAKSLMEESTVCEKPLGGRPVWLSVDWGRKLIRDLEGKILSLLWASRAW